MVSLFYSILIQIPGKCKTHMMHGVLQWNVNILIIIIPHVLMASSGQNIFIIYIAEINTPEKVPFFKNLFCNVKKVTYIVYTCYTCTYIKLIYFILRENGSL